MTRTTTRAPGLRRLHGSAATLAVGLALAGCGSDGGGSGVAGASPTPPIHDGADAAVDAPPPFGGLDSGAPTGPSNGVLTFIIRDFKLYDARDPTTNPDFENVPKTDAHGVASGSYLGPWDDHEITDPALGPDSKPVYKAGAQASLTTHGKVAFDQWFRDVPGTNVRIDIPFTLTRGPDGSYGYDSQVSGLPLSPNAPAKQFFPIDDGSPHASPFGNQGDPHNYSFTCEVHTTFTYSGGEFLHYRGDDDVWVFIDGKRVINLGGIHDPETGDVQLDALGLTKGHDYPLDFFFAERHKYGSNVLFSTSLMLRPSPK